MNEGITKKGKMQELTGFSDTQIEKIDEMGFFTAPASTRFHGDYAGGLYEHSLQVALILEEISERMEVPWIRPESPYIVGFLHDICKCDEYEQDEDGKWIRRKNTVLTGHGAKSAMLAHQILQLTEEEMLCIRYHMGAYETEDWNGYDLAIRKYETVLWTHTADMVASKIVGV